MRYIHGYKVKNTEWTKNLGIRWGTSIDLFLSIMPKQVRAEVEVVLKQLKLQKLSSAEDLNLVLKDMSILMVKHGPLLSKNWKWYAAWDTFGGYAPDLDIMQQVEAIRFWVTGNPKHTFLGDEEKFIEHIQRHCTNFLQLGPNVSRANAQAQTIHEWCREPVNWARSGTSSHPSGVEYSLGGTVYKTRKSKWSTALSKETGYIEELVREDNRHKLTMTNVAIQKREPSKIRAIITSDDQMYLKMSYISHWLETALKNHPKTTLFFNAKQANTMWINMSRACLVEDVKVPIDQTRFDHQPNRKMDTAVLNAIEGYISSNAIEPVRTDLLKTLKTVRYSLLDSKRFVTVKGSRGDVSVPSTKGLESGLRWTAFWGTILNYAELYTARDIVQELGIDAPFRDEVVQGDDDKVRAKNAAAAAAIVGAYKSMDLELNLKKFFTDFDRDEFLRQVAVWKGSRGDVSGYPARALLSLLWRNPISKDPVAGMLRAREQLKAWNMMIGRGADKMNVYREMFRDITQANGMSGDEFAGLLRTPASLGGFGFWQSSSLTPSNGKKLDVGEVVTQPVIDHRTIRGLDWNISELTRLGMEVSKADAVRYIVPNLEFSHARQEIMKGKVSDVWIPSSSRWIGTEAKGVPLTPRVSEVMPRTLAGLGLLKAKDRRADDWIQNVYIDTNDREVSRRIRQRGGRGIWLDWVDDKLSFAAPVVPGWSETAVSVMFDELIQSYWTKIVGYNSFGKDIINKMAIACENQIHQMCRDADVHLGG
jgi:hypothetical protein